MFSDNLYRQEKITNNKQKNGNEQTQNSCIRRRNHRSLAQGF